MLICSTGVIGEPLPMDTLEKGIDTLFGQQGTISDFYSAIMTTDTVPKSAFAELKSGKKYVERIPAEVWRYSPKKITKLIVTDERMVGLTQDPYWETADVDQSDNAWPRKATPTRLELFKSQAPANDLMKDFNTKLKTPEEKAATQEEPKKETVPVVQ